MFHGVARRLRIVNAVHIACVLALLIASLGVLALQRPARANDLEPPSGQPALAAFSGEKSTSPLDNNLQRLVAEQGKRTAVDIARDAPISQGDRIAVSISFAGDGASVRAALSAHGLAIANDATGLIEAYVPVNALEAIATAPGIQQITPIVPPFAEVTSQGTTVHNSPNWNVAGYDGAGVKVGVIDGGFSGYAALIGSELPAPAAARCYTGIGAFTSNIADCANGTEVHGTAVTETIVDVAPNVTIYIADPQSPADLQSTVSWMISQGVTVINHSVAWPWSGPGDGTSPDATNPLAAVSLATANNIIWVNAAGNAANKNWTGPWADADFDFQLDYIPGDECQRMNVNAGTGMFIQMRWDDSWSAAARDIDMYLWQWDGVNWFQLTSSNRVQDGSVGRRPLETISITAPASTWYCITANWYSAATAPSWIQVATFGQNLSTPVTSNSIANPAESAESGMLAVGAANWQTTSTIETFSSQGPTRDNRVKPDLVGADAADTVSYSPNPFFGTSQASPHIAGLAALVRNRFPAYTPTQVAQYLKDNADPRGTVPNNTWGYGFVVLPTIAGDTTPPTTSLPAGTILKNRSIIQHAGTPVQYSAFVLVTWTTAATDIDRFQLQKSTNGGASWTGVPLASPGARSVVTHVPVGGAVKFRVRGVDTSNNTGAWRVGTILVNGRQEAHASSIAYTGTWTGPANLAGSYGSKVRYSSVAGRKATITFTSNEFAWVSTLGSNRGKAEVWMGGSKLATVDLYSATVRTRRIVFTKVWNTSATRTIEIRVLGQRSAGTGNRVDIDGYLYR